MAASLTMERALVADPMLTTPEVERATGLNKSQVIHAAKKRRFPGAYFPFDDPRLGYRIPMADVLAYAREMGMDEDVVRARIDALMAKREERVDDD